MIVQDRSRWRVRSKRSRRSHRGFETERPGHFHGVFVVPQLSGRVFIQSRDRAEVLRRMETLKNNFHKQPFLVPPTEVPDLLEMRRTQVVTQAPISSGQWVRVKYGPYHHNIGLVKDELCDGNGDIDRYSILVVPRLHFQFNSETGAMEPLQVSGKKKLPSRLLGLADVQKRAGILNVHGSEEEFTTFGERIWHSLHVITKPKSECSLVSCPSAYELEHFTSVRINTLAATNRAFLCPRDRVKVVRGTFQGRTGLVDSLDAQMVNVLLNAESQSPAESDRCMIGFDDVERVFEIGDLVEIMLGPHSGKSGMIVSVSFDTLDIECGRTTQRSEILDVPHVVVHLSHIDVSFR